MLHSDHYRLGWRKTGLNLRTLANNRSWQDIAIKTIKVYEAILSY